MPFKKKPTAGAVRPSASQMEVELHRAHFAFQLLESRLNAAIAVAEELAEENEGFKKRTTKFSFKYDGDLGLDSLLLGERSEEWKRFLLHVPPYYWGRYDASAMRVGFENGMRAALGLPFTPVMPPPAGVTQEGWVLLATWNAYPAAEYIAADAKGVITWWTHEPHPTRYGDTWTTEEGTMGVVVGLTAPALPWRDSKAKRPEGM